MDLVKSVERTFERTVGPYVKKQSIVKGVIHLLIVLYAAKLAPELPKPVTDLFTNAYFRLFVFSLILWIAQFSPSTSLLIALAFMMTVNYSMKKPLWEFLENVSEQPAIEQPAIEQPAIEQPAIEQPVMEQPAIPLPELVGTPEVVEVTPAPIEVKEEQKVSSGCFPERKYDLTNVTGAPSEIEYGSF